jgi:hypothetical protein
LQLQTAGVTAITVDASQNVGIGTVTPSFPSGTGLAIFNTSAPRLKFTNSTTGDASTDGTQLLVSGSDFYIQQREAASVFISTNGTNAVTVDSGGGFKVLNTIGVGNATPSTSGAGITFPATQSASTNANTLDDYEEGTWTPVDGSGAGLSFSVLDARYTKIGRMVQCFAQITYPSTANTSSAAISGLPFTMATTGGGAYGAFTVYSTEPTVVVWLNLSNTTISNAYALGGANATNVTFSTDNFRLVWIYETA